MNSPTSNTCCKIHDTNGDGHWVDVATLLCVAQQCIRQQLTHGDVLDTTQAAKQSFQ